jgi:TPR repeat protein
MKTNMLRTVWIAVLFLLMTKPAAGLDLEQTIDLAEQGDSWYQTELALMYYYGKGADKNLDEAFRWYSLAAEQGSSKAQANLGVMYAEGQSVPQDSKIAANWFRKSAEQGNAMAQHNLGLMYGRGQGVEQSYVDAYVWESLAATSGLEDAIKNRDICLSKLSDDELKTAQRRESFLFLKIEQRKSSQ